MSNVIIPPYLDEKLLPNNKKNVISLLKDKYDWKTYGDISENELKKVYKEYFGEFWRVIKFLAFQGFVFSGKLNRYHFSNNNGSGFNLYLREQQRNTKVIDYDYRYAFLKLQLVPNGIFEKYDLHLLPLDHVINENLDVNRARTFFEKEGFSFLETSSLEKNQGFRTLLNNKSEYMSTEKKLFFHVGDSSYSISSEMGNLSLTTDELPGSKILRTLIKKGYKKVGDLPRDLTFLLNVPYIGQRSLDKFFESIDGNSNKSIDTKKNMKNKVESTILEEGGILYLGEKIPFREEWMQLSISQEQIDENIYQLFKNYDINLLGDIPFNMENFLREHGYRKVKSRELSAEVFNLLTIDAMQELLSQTLKQFKTKKKPTFLSERDWKIAYQRITGNTLEVIGERFGLTRERVRQIVKKSLDKLFKQYDKYFEYITDKIKNNLFVNIYDQFEDNEVAKIMRSIIEVYSLPFNIYKGYLYIGNRGKFLETIDALKSNIINEDTYILSREDIEQYVVDFLSNYAIKDGGNVDVNQVETLTTDIINKNFDSTLEPNQYVYRQNLTKARMCQIVFEKEFANGLNVYKEIDLFVEKLLEYFPDEFTNDSPRSIIANLTRDESVIILWKVGYFKHISAVNPDVKVTTLQPIKDWLQSQMSDSTIQVNTNVAFGKFADRLKSLEIDTEHALFSLLKLYFPDAFNYSRSPNLVMVGHERMEKKKIVEEYVKDFNDYVANDTLINHFIDTLGWKRTTYDQNVAVSENLIKTSNGLIHLECLNVEKEDLENIFLYVKKKINQLQNSFSIETVFEERKSTLLQMNIKDSRVLYHLLEMYYPEEFDFYRYPHIHPAGKYEVEQLSAVGQFETFFLEEDDYFLRDELYEEFIQERGWATSTYYMAFNKTKDTILEVFPEEFAHINLVEWTKPKEETLVYVLSKHLNTINKPFVHIDREIISNDELIKQFPDINPMFDWNHTLLTSILQNIGHFILLGTKKVGILTKDNSYGIQGEHDYLTYLLKNKFSGYVKVSELQKYLYRIDMCSDSIPKYYLTPNDKELEYQLINDEVILKELVVEQ